MLLVSTLPFYFPDPEDDPAGGQHVGDVGGERAVPADHPDQAAAHEHGILQGQPGNQVRILTVLFFIGLHYVLKFFQDSIPSPPTFRLSV